MNATWKDIRDSLSEIAVSIPAFWSAYLLGMPPRGAFLVGVAAMSILLGYHRGDFAFKGKQRSRAKRPLISLPNALFLLQSAILNQWAAYLNGQALSLSIKAIIGFAFVEAVILAGRHAWLLAKSKPKQNQY